MQLFVVANAWSSTAPTTCILLPLILSTTAFIETRAFQNPMMFRTIRYASRIRRTRSNAMSITTIPRYSSATRLFATVATPQTSNVTVLETPQLPSIPRHNVEEVDEYDVESYLTKKGIRSRPKGNWDVFDPLGWTKSFGRRSADYENQLAAKVKLSPGDDGYHDLTEFTNPSNVTVVRTVEEARIVLKKLEQFPGDDVVHACDTEVMDISLKDVGPVGNGYVTCVSIYSGPDFDYGLGQPLGSKLWIDNLDEACGVLQEFKSWFEDERHLKVWHNYGFDRHVMWNEGIDVKGLAGDTMHMARLEDTSRSKVGKGGGYSLEALTEDLLRKRKASMKEIFGVKRKRKDGSLGTLVDIPPVEVMQRDPLHRYKWIAYSAYDAEGTYGVYQVLKERLKAKEWITTDSTAHNLFDYYWLHMRQFAEVLTDMERRGIRVDAKQYLAKVEKTAREDRQHHSKLFRKWAASVIGHPHGLAINPASSLQLCTLLFGGSKNAKTSKVTEESRVFQVPREELEDDALEAFSRETFTSSALPTIDADIFTQMKVAQLKAMCKENGLKVSGKKADLQERLKAHFSESQVSVRRFDHLSDEEVSSTLKSRGMSLASTAEERRQELEDDEQFIAQTAGNSAEHDCIEIARRLEEASKLEGSTLEQFIREQQEEAAKPTKKFGVTIKSIGLKPMKFTAGGAPSVTADVIRELAGDPFSDPPKYGTAYKQFGEEGCKALASLGAIGSIDTMIDNFLTTLQTLSDDQSRVHGSLNLNTETGRLSSRRPNLQNQPALEKDKYQIRKAFQASPGHNLIVADYGQLELRILASITKCESMIDAFKAGGDFHSRTALDMFDYVKANVESGDCLLEWDYANGDPPKPLLKDVFAAERRKAKTLNFSIAYGKTAHGLSQDWGVKKTEAQQMLDAWYKARPEVDEWQQNTKEHARTHGETKTLMGRYRQLPQAVDGDFKTRGQAERASINTPIQGGAADIAMMAMNKINAHQKLKDLGWVLLLQIHDEVILEGPEETAEEAFEIVIDCMQNPWVFGLDETVVPLIVDGTYVHKTWYDAK